MVQRTAPRARSKRTWIAVLVGVLVVAAVGMAGAGKLRTWWQARSSAEAARASAAAILDSVVAGDIDAAVARMDTGSMPPGQFVGAQLALDTAERSQIDYQITEVIADETQALVRFTMVIDGSSQSHQVVFGNDQQDWRPAASHMLVYLLPVGPTLINGHTAPAATALWALPGSYEVSPESEYLDYPEPVVALQPGATLSLHGAVLKDQYVAQVTALYRAALDTCTQATGQQTTSCFTELRRYAVSRDTTVRLLSHPADLWHPEEATFTWIADYRVWAGQITQLPYQIAVTGTLTDTASKQTQTVTDLVVDARGHPRIVVEGATLNVHP